MNEKISSDVASLNALVNALVNDTAGDFDHSRIRRTNAVTAYSKLVANLELIKGLHEVYCIHRRRGKDDTHEEALLEKAEEYVTELKLKAHQAVDSFAEYEKSFTAAEATVIKEAEADEVKTKFRPSSD